MILSWARPKLLCGPDYNRLMQSWMDQVCDKSSNFLDRSDTPTYHHQTVKSLPQLSKWKRYVKKTWGRNRTACVHTVPALKLNMAGSRRSQFCSGTVDGRDVICCADDVAGTRCGQHTRETKDSPPTTVLRSKHAMHDLCNIRFCLFTSVTYQLSTQTLINMEFNCMRMTCVYLCIYLLIYFTHINIYKHNY